MPVTSENVMRLSRRDAPILAEVIGAVVDPIAWPDDDLDMPRDPEGDRVALRSIREKILRKPGAGYLSTTREERDALWRFSYNVASSRSFGTEGARDLCVRLFRRLWIDEPPPTT